VGIVNYSGKPENRIKVLVPIPIPKPAHIAKSQRGSSTENEEKSRLIPNQLLELFSVFLDGALCAGYFNLEKDNSTE
jgi:hypothetical protein